MMNRLPKSKTGQLADLLRGRLEAGAWVGRMPSERQLAAEYFVSRTTLRDALGVLEEEGLVLGPSSTRSGRVISVGKGDGEGRSRADEAVVLTPSLRESPVLLAQLAVMREWLGALGIQLNVREAVRLTEERDPVRTLRRWREGAPGVLWVLHKMPGRVQLGVQELGMKALVFGSVFPGIELPYVDVDFRAVARHAAGMSLARGHRRLAVLVHRTVLAGDAAVIEGVQDELARHDAAPLVVMKHDFNRVRLIDALDRRIVAAEERPEVLLVVKQHHLLTALPHLLHRGLRLPEDLSVVYLSNDPAVERLSPLPDRYDLGERLLRRVAKSIQMSLGGEAPGSMCLLPRFVSGETLGRGLKGG